MSELDEQTWGQWLDRNCALEGLIHFSPEEECKIWKPTKEDKKVAWVLYTEMQTRISTQSLHYRSGDEETALDSIYNLFELLREQITKEGLSAQHFSTIAIYFFNIHLRPFTALWHKKKLAGRFEYEDDCREFRKDLSQIQVKMKEFSQLLGKIAKGKNYVPSYAEKDEGSIKGNSDFESVVTFEAQLLDEDLFKAEQSTIIERRYGDNTEQIKQVDNLVGLACSGGGIRSATFCLGVSQALSKRGLLPSIDYLSTVSGGGYFGSFLSSYLNDSDKNVGLEKDQLPFHEDGRTESLPIRQLRNNSKYLLKDGFLGQSRIVGLMLFGMLINILTLLPVLFIALTISKTIALGVDEQLFKQSTWYLLGFLGIVLGFLLLGIPIINERWLANRKHIIKYSNFMIYIALLMLSIWFLGLVLPALYQSLLVQGLSSFQVFFLFSAIPFLLSVIAFKLGLSSIIGKMMIIFAGISGSLLIIMSFLILNKEIPNGALWIGGLIIISILLWFWLKRINVNHISPHRFYRNSLVDAYLLRRDPQQTNDPQLLSRLQSQKKNAPYHLINTAVNLPNSKNPELRGRNSDFFLFSRHFCGSKLLGYCRTDELEKKDPSLDLGTAMAISGAAASSYMGTTTIKGLSFWLSLLNIRLAYWLPNQNKFEEIKDGQGIRPFSLWKELFGKIDESDKFLNLSDGGHIENLGIYELLRRRCKFIIAIDAEADPNMKFSGLMKLIRYSHIDFGINIKIDLNDLHKNEAGFSKAHFVLGKIDYGDGAIGYLLYIKSSLTGNERDYILDYQQSHQTFPHESTADQFFNEAQFEAYRALGEHIGDDLFHEELIKGKDPENLTLEDWFSVLIDNLGIEI